jgi:hypothetical protein
VAIRASLSSATLLIFYQTSIGLRSLKLYEIFLKRPQPESATPIVTKLTVTSWNPLYLTEKIVNPGSSGSGMLVAF